MHCLIPFIRRVCGRSPAQVLLNLVSASPEKAVIANLLPVQAFDVPYVIWVVLDIALTFRALFRGTFGSRNEVFQQERHGDILQ